MENSGTARAENNNAVALANRRGPDGAPAPLQRHVGALGGRGGGGGAGHRAGGAGPTEATAAPLRPGAQAGPGPGAAHR